MRKKIRKIQLRKIIPSSILTSFILFFSGEENYSPGADN